MRRQTVRPDALCLGIPRFSTRENRPYDVPSLQRAIAEANAATPACPALDVRVVELDADYGPLCKLLGALSATSGPASAGTLVVTVDDDQIYDERLLETIVAGAAAHPDSVVCFCGHAISANERLLGVYEWGFRSSGFDGNALARAFQLDSGSRVDIVSGWCGVAYPRRLLPDALDWELEAIRTTLNPVLHRNDDVYISAWLSRLGVPRVLVAYPADSRHVQREDKIVGRQNPLSLSGSSGYVAGNVRHLFEWWSLISYMRSHGFFAETARIAPRSAVPYKSVTAVGATATVALVSLCAAAVCALTRLVK